MKCFDPRRRSRVLSNSGYPESQCQQSMRKGCSILPPAIEVQRPSVDNNSATTQTSTLRRPLSRSWNAAGTSTHSTLTEKHYEHAMESAHHEDHFQDYSTRRASAPLHHFQENHHFHAAALSSIITRYNPTFVKNRGIDLLVIACTFLSISPSLRIPSGCYASRVPCSALRGLPP